MKDEFENLQLDSFHHRGALVNEQIEVFKEVWANDPRLLRRRLLLLQRGERHPQAGAAPPPAHPRRWQQRGRPRTHRRLCDGWLGISLRPHQLAEHRARLLQRCEVHGRDGADMPIAMLHGIQLTDDPDHRATLADQERAQGVVGTIEQVVEELREFEEAGLTHMIASARRFGRPGGGPRSRPRRHRHARQRHHPRRPQLACAGKAVAPSVTRIVGKLRPGRLYHWLVVRSARLPLVPARSLRHSVVFRHPLHPRTEALRLGPERVLAHYP